MDLYLLNLISQTMANPLLDSFMVGLTTIGPALLPLLVASLPCAGIDERS